MEYSNGEDTLKLPASRDWRNYGVKKTQSLPQNSSYAMMGPKATDSNVYRVGIYGWRKRCLYVLIILLFVLVVVNFTLTVWIMNVMQFTANGLGGMRFVDDRVEITGFAEFDNPVNFKRIRSASNAPLFLESDRAIFLTARDDNGSVSSRLILNNDGIQALCNRFDVVNNEGKVIFSAAEDEVAVAVENLRILSESGTVFDGAVQTSAIRPDYDSSLTVESPTRGLDVQVAHDVEILSTAGDVRVDAFNSIVLQSIKGEVYIDTPNVYMTRLAQGTDQGQTQYQVCMCENGVLFLAANGADCRASKNICG